MDDIDIRSRHYAAFTIVETLVVVVVLGILFAAGAALSFSNGNRERDIARDSDMIAVAGLLESHYEAHGRYPVITELINLDGSIKGMTSQLLDPPGGDEVTAIVSSNTPSLSEYGYLTYDTASSLCSSGPDCGQRFKLFWRSEVDDIITTKTSTH